MNEQSQSSHWTEVVGQLMEKLTGKNMSMNYEFDDLTIDIPSARGPGGRDLVEYNGRLMENLQLPQKPIKKVVVARHS